MHLARRAAVVPLFFLLSFTRLVAQRLPDKISDRDFWSMVHDWSEPTGTFPSENFLSNEAGYQYVIPELLRSIKPGGVYIGVGPEQNFTYIAALHPQIAFIVDIRRQAIIQHLLYKAVFELAENRADFLSLLFARPRPAGLSNTLDPKELFAAFDSVRPDSVLYRQTRIRIREQLLTHHGFALDSEDLDKLDHVYEVIFTAGSRLNYSSRSTYPGGTYFFQPGVTGFLSGSTGFSTTPPIRPSDSTRRIGALDSIVTKPSIPIDRILIMPPNFPGQLDYATLMALADTAGVQRSFLADESHYNSVRTLELNNLLIPIVGDFAGDRALRSIGSYLSDHHAVVSAIYTSNVEQYLFQNNVWRSYYANVAALPHDDHSIFIRSLPGVPASSSGLQRGFRLGSYLGSVELLLQAVLQNQVYSYRDLENWSH